MPNTLLLDLVPQRHHRPAYRRRVHAGSVRIATTATAFLLALLVATVPAAAQTETTGKPPVVAPRSPDSDEANAGRMVPLHIGAVTLSGSAWLDTALIDGHDGQEQDSFRVRRARIGLSGNFTRKVGWNVAGELTSASFRNAFLVFRFAEQFHVRVGQATPPAGIERGTNPLALEVIDRSRLSSQLSSGQDIGIGVSNAAPFKGWVSYAVSVVNGAGMNRLDNNLAKDVVVRLEVTPPAVRGLTFNVNGSTGKQPQGRRTRSGAGVAYDSRRFKVLAEGLRQQHEGRADRQGFILIGVYRLRPRAVTPHFRLFEVAGRYMAFTDPAAEASVPTAPDEDGAVPTLPSATPHTTRSVQAGGNYYVNQRARVMANVTVPLHSGTRAATFLTRLQVMF